MLRKIRIGVSLLLFTLLTLYFLDAAGALPDWMSGLAAVQFLPALLALNVGALAFVAVLTLLFGRVYCSSLCPLGVYQDVVGWLSRRRRRRPRYGYSRPKTWLRWGVVALAVLALLAGFTGIVALLDPYSAWGRIASNLLRPLYLGANNLLASVSSATGSYRFHFMEVAILSMATFAVAAATFLLVGALAFRYGRTWCNTICPVGTLLGALSRFSLFKVRIDVSKCNNCGLCGLKCKAWCIDSKNHQIDYSRCVGCFDCIDNCKHDAVSFSPRLSRVNREKAGSEQVSADLSRRRFLAALAATAAATPALGARGVVGAVTGRHSVRRKVPITPPGSRDQERFLSRCTSCQLCVSRCPSRVLRPAMLEYGIEGMMQPTLSFERGFCNYDCTLCSEICPAGAILPLSVEQKHAVQIGRAVFRRGRCVVVRDGTSCGACSEHCPTQAVRMVPFREGVTIPRVDPSLCVGCGGCEYICPAGAIHVEGNEVHAAARPPEQAEQEHIELDGFGF